MRLHADAIFEIARALELLRDTSVAELLDGHPAKFYSEYAPKGYFSVTWVMDDYDPGFHYEVKV